MLGNSSEGRPRKASKGQNFGNRTKTDLNFALPVDWIVNLALRPVQHMETVPSPGAAPPDWVQRYTTLRTPKRFLGTVKPGSND
jgi:hypothetical protein